MVKRRANAIAIAVLMVCVLASPAAAQLADTPWPMFHHDLNHTGLSTHHGPDTSTVKWTFSTEVQIDGSAAIGADGTIYIGTHDKHSCTESRLYAIYPDGTEKWQWTPPSHKIFNSIDSTPAVASDGTVYAGCGDRRLYALYPNGTEKWEFYASPPWWWKWCKEYKGFVLTSPAIGPDGTIYIGNNNHKLYAINPDGSLKWSYKTKGAIQSSPAIGADGTIYVGSHDKKLHAVNPDGTKKWKYSTRCWIVSSPAIGADGTIYVGSNDRKLHAVNPDGTSKWKYSTGGYIKSSPAIGADGTIYVGSNDRKLHAVNPDGTQKWTYTTDCYVQSSPAIDADGTIYVGSYDKKLYAINPDGSPLWEYSTGDIISYSSPAIASDGTVYIGNQGGSLYAFGPGIQSNRPPVIDSIGDRTVDETETLMIDVDATDPDGDPLTYSCNRTDLFMDFDPATGTGNWTPDYNDAGTCLVDFGVSDDEGCADNETIEITVLDANRPPVLDPIEDRAIDENSLLEFTVNATDPDNVILEYSASNLPTGATFNPHTRTFSWTPAFEQAQTYPDVHFEVSDGELTDWENITITVNNTNRPPVLDQIGDKSVDENSLLEFTVNATELDGDTLTYSASNLPDGAVFDTGTRTFSWTPSFEQAQTYPDVHFEVSDGELINHENITIRVNGVNRPPVLDQIRDKSVNENSLLEFTVHATDPDNNTLTYSISNLPDGAVFDPGTRTFSWTPSFEQAGTYSDVHFEISDGELIDWENITITVNNTNRPPVLDQIGDKSVDENSLLEFTVNATDPDGATLAYSVSNFPTGATFNPHTRTFLWTPTFEQAGTYPDVHFEVSDGELTDWENITITVNNTNRPPVLDQIGDKSVNETSLLEFTVNATDQDGDTLTYSASNLPDGAAFDPGTQMFSWTPTFDQTGTYPDVHFEVSDGELTDWENITISVNDTNRPPVLDQIGDKSVNETSLLEFTVNATEPDGDTLTYSASNLPDGAVFNSTTHTFFWTPTFEQAGTYPDVHFEVSDGELTDWENIAITVNGVNRPPVLDQIGDKSVDENSLLEFTVNATDPDGATLAYSASNLPTGAAFNPLTRTFSWTPTFEQAGTYPDVHFWVSDDELTDWENITIRVNNTNRPPVLNQIGDKSVDENSLLEFTVNATEPDGDTLTYSASNLPDGAVFDPGTRTFSWTPTFGQTGTHPDVHFEVSDGELTDWENITIRVNGVNRPPILNQIGDKSVDENSSLEFTVNATEPDGDTPTYSASNLPDGAVFDPGTRTFSWTPTFEQAGIYRDMHFEVSDDELTDWENITITVNDTNRPPVLDQIEDRTIDENSSLEFTVNATDPDNGILTYSASNLPTGAVFNPLTRTFSWTPTFEQVGTYPDVHFEISDGELTDWENITIKVNNTNRPPVLDQIGDRTIDENSSLEFTVNATDPDGDTLTYSASNLPDGAVFDPDTGTFSWTPTSEQAGTYPDMHFETSDGKLTDWKNITIRVVGADTSPKISIITPSSEVMSQQQFIVNITVDPGITEVYGVEYDLFFDPDVIHAEFQNEGDFLNQDGADTNVYINTIDNGIGKISFAATRVDTQIGVTDPGILAIIRFTAVREGECSDIVFGSVEASDSNASAITMNLVNSSICMFSNQPPSAAAMSMHRHNNIGTKYLCKAYFNATESGDPDGEIIDWRWSFGDGNYGTGELVEHVYASWKWNGCYEPFTATLTVTDDMDLTDTTYLSVNVYIAGDANGDGEVDIFDATIVGLEWDEVCRYDGWDTDRRDQADLNNDCVVDIFDAVIIGANWDHTAG